MKIVRPVTVTPAILFSTNVAEPGTSPAAWASGTTYASGAQVSYNHRVYQSLQASNAGKQPDQNTTWWQDIGPTNTWAMFDNYSTTQTVNTTSIAVTLKPATRVDSVVLQNLAAASVNVQMNDAVDGLVYNQTFSLTATSAITDWFAYFMEPIDRLTDFTITNMPQGYSNPTINVTISDSVGATVKCGSCLIGQSKDIGGTQLGAQASIYDYSIKSTDAFGNTTITQRAFSKRLTASVWVNNNYIDRLQAMLATYRATPLCFVGSDAYTSTVVFGFYKDFAITISMPTVSVCAINIEGLT